MTEPLASVAPKLAKLLPRLASDHDGEVVATVHAIRRTLANAGTDLHALAARIAAPAEGRAADGEGAADNGGIDWRDLVARLLRRVDDLTDREHVFIVNVSRFLRAGSDPTQKQGAWLLAIADRVLGGAE